MRRFLLATCTVVFASPAEAADLTLHRVMLSAAGVGYFEYGAKLDGAASLGLDVPLDQVDDVLRSLAVFDSQGGIGSIELPGRDNVRQAFSDVPFTQDMLNSPAALLDSLRGEAITVAGPAAMTGRIVGTSNEILASAPQSAPRRPASRARRVTLLTADGLRQFILEDATSMQLTDAGLRARFGAALDAARQQSAASQRHLTLRMSGAGARDVTVGYVAVAPLWKASYRVVLPAEGVDHARVQGWAVLENQSGADWHGVDLTLQAGNPVTFRQAIYASYYATRPDVPVEVLGRLLPDTDTFTENSVQGQEQSAPPRHRALRGFMAAPSPPVAAMAPAPMPGVQQESIAAAPMAPPDQQTAAAATVVGATFHIATPIDLARGHTASVPILDRELPAERLDWLQANSIRPVTALRIKNDSATALPAGVLTLYAQDKGADTEFSGDARLSGLQAGETRLLGFAEDLQTHAERSVGDPSSTLLNVKLANGVLTESTRTRYHFTAILTAPPHDPRRVLVEFAKYPGAKFTLDGDGAAVQDATSTAWRVLASLQPNETRTLHAYADRVDETATTLLPSDGDFNEQTLLEVLNQGTLDSSARAKLQTLADLRAAETDKQTALQRLSAQRDAVLQDEDRVRKNLQAVAGPGNLHDKLLNALETDEATLTQSRQDIDRAQTQADAAHAGLEKAVKEAVLF